MKNSRVNTAFVPDKASNEFGEDYNHFAIKIMANEDPDFFDES